LENTMKSATKKKNDTAVLRIEGEMSIYRATELKEALLAPLASASALEVDLSGVTEIDTAGLQLLMLAKIVALARGCELRLLAHSPAVLDVLELLSLTGYFGDQIVMPSRAAAGSSAGSSNTSGRAAHGT
jgi:anti-sigma B factor antagonist